MAICIDTSLAYVGANQVVGQFGSDSTKTQGSIFKPDANDPTLPTNTPNNCTGYVLLTGADYRQLQLSSGGDFDYGFAGALWSLAFTSVIGLYFASHGIGLVLDFIRRG